MVKTTRYLGGVEWISNTTNTIIEKKRYIGGFLIITETVGGASPGRKYLYQFGDHLGSTDTLVDETGLVRERLSFDAHGNRRKAGMESLNGSTADLTNAWVTRLSATAFSPNTTHGFTGHEHIDAANIVHMNGRLYDPALGRMLSPDPVVQEMYNAQNLNRYTYVLNNPLSYTDPSGLNFVRKYWRQIAATVISIWLPGASWFAEGLMASNAVATAAVTGFIAGGISSGTMQGAMAGAFSGAIFAGIGEVMPGQGTPGKVLAHGMAGGVMSELQGGKFGHGFASAAVTQLMSPVISGVADGDPNFNPGRTAIAALVGGTTSALTGGKFANGALTAAFSRAFNDNLHGMPKTKGRIDLNLLDPSSSIYKKSWLTEYPDGYFVIVAHGNSVWIEDQSQRKGGIVRALYVDADGKSESLIKYMKDAGYKKGMPIFLGACNSALDPGKGLVSIAQQLSNRLGVQVIAPNAYTHIFPDGKVVVAGKIPDPVHPKEFLPDPSRPGDWQFLEPNR